MKRFPAVIAVLFLSLASPCQAQDIPAGDKVFGAMRDEMSRTMRRLRMKGMPGPYFVSYAVEEGTRAQIAAAFGALKISNINPFLQVKVHVRVGDYAFDNTQFVPAGSGDGSLAISGASFEEDYDNLRAALWAVSDEAYKGALENLAKKKAFKEKRLIKDVFDDLSREAPVRSSEPVALSSIDQALWEGRVRRLSAVFKSYPDIQDSQVSLNFQTGTGRLLTSEGTAVRESDTHISLVIVAWTQTLDGLRIADSTSLHYPSWADVPKLEDLEAEARTLAASVRDTVHGAGIDAYIGPVLFEDQAAGEFFDVELVDNISNPRESWSENESNHFYDRPPFVNRLGMRVAVPFLTFVDDPLLERYAGIPLLGHYRIDDEGMPAQRLELVRKGRLVDLYMSRAPIRERRHSNGHGRSALGDVVSGRIGNLLVTSDPQFAVPKAELKKKLRDMCRELDLDYGIIVRRMGGLSPIAASKIYVADGREEPLKGLEFTGAGYRPLRDIVAASREVFVFNFYHGSPGRGAVPASIVAPSILVREMEVKKTERKPEHLPYLKHPFFAR